MPKYVSHLDARLFILRICNGSKRIESYREMKPLRGRSVLARLSSIYIQFDYYLLSGDAITISGIVLQLQ